MSNRLFSGHLNQMQYFCDSFQTTGEHVSVFAFGKDIHGKNIPESCLPVLDITLNLSTEPHETSKETTEQVGRVRLSATFLMTQIPKHE